MLYGLSRYPGKSFQTIPRNRTQIGERRGRMVQFPLRHWSDTLKLPAELTPGNFPGLFILDAMQEFIPGHCAASTSRTPGGKRRTALGEPNQDSLRTATPARRALPY
jgi:hypothetical protein